MNKGTTTPLKRRLIFLNIVITCIATSMMSTALATALPPIMYDLDISATTAQWLSSGYYLCMGVMVPLFAFFISRFPTKNLYLVVLSVFIMGLLLCLVAPNFPLMMFGRILQAAANGVLSPLGQIVLLTAYPPHKRGSVMGWYGLSLGAAPVLAPTLTGVLIDSIGWRSVFVLPLGIMCLSFVMALFAFTNILKTKQLSFPALSFFTCALTFSGITLGISNIGIHPFFSLWVSLPLFIGLIAGIFFAYRQLHSPNPFLELRAFSNPQFTLSVIGSMILYITTMAAIVLLPLYIQNILGLSATLSGLITLPGSLAMAVMSPIAGKLYQRFGMQGVLPTGAICLLFSNFGMCFIDVNTSIWIAAFLNVLRQAAVGCLLMTFVVWGTESLPQKNVSHGTVILTSFRTVAGSAGMSISVAIMTLIAGSLTEVTPQFADLQGLHVAFFVLGFTNIILFVIAFFAFKHKRKMK